MEKAWDFARCWVALLQILVWFMSFCLLVKVVGHREQPASTCSLAMGRKFCWETTAPTLSQKKIDQGCSSLSAEL